MATTAFHPGGYPGRPYGSFAGREPFVPPVVAEDPARPRPDDGGRKGKKKARGIIKPTGLLERPRKSVQDRVDEAREVHAEVAQAAVVARQQEEAVQAAAAEAVAAETRRTLEIAELLQKRIRSEEEDKLLMILMSAV